MSFTNKIVFRRIRIGIFLFLSIFSSQVYADCDGMIDIVRKKLRHSVEAVENPSFIDCKVWPQDSSIAVVSMVSFQETLGAVDADAGFYDLRIFLLKGGAGKVISELYEKNAFPSDAIGLNAVKFDFAPYVLVPGQRAFGIRARFSNQSTVSSWEHEQLNLYMVQGAVLNRILGGLVTSKKLYEKINDCDESFTDVSRRLIVASAVTYGKADLIVKERAVNEKSNLINEKCRWKKTIKSKSYLLRFNGQIYVIPEDLKWYLH